MRRWLRLRSLPLDLQERGLATVLRVVGSGPTSAPTRPSSASPRQIDFDRLPWSFEPKWNVCPMQRVATTAKHAHGYHLKDRAHCEPGPSSSQGQMATSS